MDKYYLGENPMSPDDDLIIVRTPLPTAIFLVREGHQAQGEHYAFFSYKKTDGITEQWTLSVSHYFITQKEDNDTAKIQNEIKKAWHWYLAYMKFEDGNIDEDARISKN